MVDKTCEVCGKSFSCFPSEEGRKFCSKECLYKKRGAGVLFIGCSMCGKESRRSPSSLKKSKSGLYFCSSKCSCSFWNSSERVPKRKLEGKCKMCDAPIQSSRRLCLGCKRKSSIEEFTLESLFMKSGTSHRADVSVRAHSRYKYNTSTLPKLCEMCGYDKFYQVCHIVPIKDFPKEAKIGVVNDFSNLIAMCPNCHWEFDHSKISIELVRSKVDQRNEPPIRKTLS